MEGWADGWVMDDLNKQNVPQLRDLKKGIVLSYEAKESHQLPLLGVPLSSQPHFLPLRLTFCLHGAIWHAVTGACASSPDVLQAFLFTCLLRMYSHVGNHIHRLLSYCCDLWVTLLRLISPNLNTLFFIT